MIFEPVKSFADVEFLRQVRNTCCEYMTRHTNTISPEQQLAWWQSLAHAFDRIYLVYDHEIKLDGPIGYGLIRYKDERDWLTGGLIPVVRNRGVGAELFRGLMNMAMRPCWLEVRIDNIRAHKLYLKLGFEEASRTDQIITMRHL